MENKRELGTEAEKIAANYLLENNYIVVEKNFRCKLGEIDIIANDEDYLVFIEVKYRKTDKKGLPREAVNIYKQRTIIKVAKWYLVKHNLYDSNCRFDVLEMMGDMDNLEINLIKDAFRII